MLLLFVAAAFGYLFFLNQTAASNIRHDSQLLPPPTQNPEDPPLPDQPKGNGSNYLIIGADARGETSSRSDVIVVAHIPEDRSKVYLVHFPRDLYVPIPGRNKDKINASFAYGGAPLLVRTLQNLLGIEIDHVAKTDFSGFKAMTDAVGGVTVWAEESSAGVKKGWNDLNGEQALAFVRERKALSEGDISRGLRQQAFIKALLLKSVSREVLTNPIKLAEFVDAATSNLVVDEKLDMGTIRAEAFGLRGIRGGDVVFITAPFSGFGTSPAGGSIEIVDDAKMKALGDAIRTDTLDTYADAKTTP